ncbi:MAG: hypothetical protein V7L25_24725 [Nostoc sp.]
MKAITAGDSEGNNRAIANIKINTGFILILRRDNYRVSVTAQNLYNKV